jgi:hypothetical protein
MRPFEIEVMASEQGDYLDKAKRLLVMIIEQALFDVRCPRTRNNQAINRQDAYNWLLRRDWCKDLDWWSNLVGWNADDYKFQELRRQLPFTVEQVKRILPGYENTFSHTNTKLSQNIRGFIEAIA